MLPFETVAFAQIQAEKSFSIQAQITLQRHYVVVLPPAVLIDGCYPCPPPRRYRKVRPRYFVIFVAFFDWYSS